MVWKNVERKNFPREVVAKECCSIYNEEKIFFLKIKKFCEYFMSRKQLKNRVESDKDEKHRIMPY
jgi:hypothetical protein